VLGSFRFVKFRNYELKLPSFEFDFSLVSIEFAYQGLVLVSTNVPILQWYVALLTNVYAIPMGIQSNVLLSLSTRSKIEHDGVLVPQIRHEPLE
jgi:hypothetical protein